MGTGAAFARSRLPVSFAGNLTYPKAQPLRDVAGRVPLDSLLVETDAPWLAPRPTAASAMSPRMVVETAAALAALHTQPGRNRRRHHAKLLPAFPAHFPIRANR